VLDPSDWRMVLESGESFGKISTHPVGSSTGAHFTTSTSPAAMRGGVRGLHQRARRRGDFGCVLGVRKKWGGWCSLRKMDALVCSAKGPIGKMAEPEALALGAS